MRYILGGHRTDLFFLPRYGSGFIGPSNVMASNFSPDAQISKSPMLKLFVAMRRFQIYFGYFCGGRLHFFNEILNSSSFITMLLRINSLRIISS